MADPAKALATQIANIQQRTGRTLDELFALLRDSGRAKHGEQVALLKSSLGMGHGDANTVVHLMKQAEQPPQAADADPLDDIYSGPKAQLRPIHDRVLGAVRDFGEFEEAPKKAYVSLRRRKQFAAVGPATKTQVEVGLNLADVAPTDRLEELPAGRMCSHRVRLSSPDDVDADLIAWLHRAYHAAG